MDTFWIFCIYIGHIFCQYFRIICTLDILDIHAFILDIYSANNWELYVRWIYIFVFNVQKIGVYIYVLLLGWPFSMVQYLLLNPNQRIVRCHIFADKISISFAIWKNITIWASAHSQCWLLCFLVFYPTAKNPSAKKSCFKKSFLLQVRQYLNGICPNQKMYSIGKDKKYLY